MPTFRFDAQQFANAHGTFRRLPAWKIVPIVIIALAVMIVMIPLIFALLILGALVRLVQRIFGVKPRRHSGFGGAPDSPFAGPFADPDARTTPGAKPRSDARRRNVRVIPPR